MEGDKNSFIKNFFRHKTIKYIFKSSTLMTYALIVFACMVIFTIIALAMDAIITFFNNNHHVFFVGRLNYITFIFFTFILLTTTWIILENHFDDIKDEIEKKEYNPKQKLKMLKDKYHL